MRTEPLSSNELEFLKLQLKSAKRSFVGFFSKFVIVIFVLSFVLSFYKAASGNQNAFSASAYFATTTLFLLISALGVYIVFLLFHRNLMLDIRQARKTIEPCHISRKQFMPHNNTYHFYIDSAHCLSVQVPKADYDRMNPGDELSIEYSCHSGIFFGYF